MARGRARRTSRWQRLLCSLSCAVASASGASAASAGGLAFYRDGAGWHALRGGEERAVVIFADGVEHLFSAVRLNPAVSIKNASEVAWLFPIRAPAESVSAAPLRDLPSFSGRQPLVEIQRTAATLLELMAASQVWPVPALMARFWDGQLEASEEHMVFAAPTAAGVVTEILSDGESAAEKLKRHGVVFDDVSWLPSALAGTTWVLVHVADLATYRQASITSDPQIRLAFAAHFPAARGYYPLLSNRERDANAIEITTLGLTRAATTTRYDVTTEHRLGAFKGTDQVTALTRADADAKVTFTRFYLSAAGDRAESNTAEPTAHADFFFEPGAPAAVERAAQWLRAPYHTVFEIAGGLIGFFTLLLVAHFGVRALWPASSRPDARSCARMAITNVFTLLWPLAAGRRRAEARGESARAIFAFALTSSLVFTLFVSLLHWTVAP